MQLLPKPDIQCPCAIFIGVRIIFGIETTVRLDLTTSSYYTDICFSEFNFSTFLISET